MSDTLLPKILTLQETLNRVILGKSDVIERVVTTLLAGGHLLLEDQPGVGKTTLAAAIARAISGQFSRIQFTADLLPSDVIGVRVFRRQQEAFEFVQGPIFSHLVLADELNRAPPKTQSALLQAMSEHAVTIERETFPLPDPFMVIATQNPRGAQGTYPLPESQRDRFLIRLSIGYPAPDVERRILAERRLKDQPLDDIRPVLTPEDLRLAREEVKAVTLGEPVLEYMARLAQATRNHPEVTVAASPRAVLALMRACQALAWLKRRAFVDLDTVKYLLPNVWGHRLALRSLNPLIVGEGASPDWVTRELLERVAIT